MSQLQFWQKNFNYPANSYILDGVGNIQYTVFGGISGPTPPTWSTNPAIPTLDGTITDWTWRGFGGKSAELQKPIPAGPFIQTQTDAISVSRGNMDAGKLVLLSFDGKLDASMGGGGGGGQDWSKVVGDAPNIGQVLQVGNNSTLEAIGSGVIDATEINGVPIPSTNSGTAGKIPITQGDGSAAWADPLVQGISPVTTAVSGINPVLIGAEDSTGKLANIQLNAGGNVPVTVSNPVTSVTVSGTVTSNQGTSPWIVAQVTSPPTPWITNIEASGTALTATGSSLNVNVTGGSTGNAAASATGSGVPTDADYIGVDISGNLVGQTGLALGATTKAATVAIVDASGNQITSFGSSTVTANQGTSPWVVAPITSPPTPWSVSGTVSAKLEDGAGNAITSDARGSARPLAVEILDASGNQITSFGSSSVAVTAIGDGTTTPVKVQNLTNAKSLSVAVVDGSGNQITSFGGGTQYVTGATEATPTGTLALGWDGSVVKALPLDGSGYLEVNVKAGGSGGGAITYANPTTSTLQVVQVNLSTAGDHTIIAGISSPPGQTIRIMKMFLILGGTAEQDLTFKDSTPATLLPSSPFIPPASIQLMLDGVPWFITAAGKDFVINLSAAQKVTGLIYYTQS